VVPHLGVIEGERRGWGVVPVLAVPNEWYQVPIPDPRFMGYMPNEELEVECVQGHLTLWGLHTEEANLAGVITEKFVKYVV
jgi:hypothetical protein